MPREKMVEVQGARQAQRALAKYAREAPKETARALNKTAKRVATRTRRDTAKASGLPQKAIKNRIKAFAAKMKDRDIVASVWAGLRAVIPYGDIPGARVNPRNMVISAGRLRMQAFRVRMPDGKNTLAVRKPNATHRKRPDGQWTQLPIEEPRVRLPADQIEPRLVRHAVVQFARFFPKEIARLLDLKAKQVKK